MTVTPVVARFLTFESGSWFLRSADEGGKRRSRAVPTISRIGECRRVLVGTLRFAHPTCSRSALGGRGYYSVVGPAVAIREHAPDRMIAVHVHAHRDAVPQFVADVEIDAFTQEELPVAVHIDGFPGLALHGPRGVSQSWHGDLCRGRQFEAEIAGLTGLGRKVAARIVHRARQRLIGEVDDELAGPLDVGRRVLDPAIGPQVGCEHAQRRILAKYIEKAERRGVDHPGRPNRRYPGDRPDR